MGVSVTDKLDMSQVTVATKKKLKSEQIQELETTFIEAWCLDQEDDRATLPHTDRALS